MTSERELDLPTVETRLLLALFRLMVTARVPLIPISQSDSIYISRRARVARYFHEGIKCLANRFLSHR